MDRRSLLKILAGTLVGGGAAGITLTTAFKPKIPAAAKPQTLAYTPAESHWGYTQLNPLTTAEMAYQAYSEGSCMYATFKSIVSQLADQVGEPFASFPLQMMKYGHGGIGGYGTVCGALNGAAAVIGLLVADKKNQDALIESLYRWYEESRLPLFKPATPLQDFIPPQSVSQSVLCHASNTNWSKTSGYTIKSNQRKERCRRLTADVASQTVVILNRFSDNRFVTTDIKNETVRTCMTCHGSESKLANTSGKMDCGGCHSESLGHRFFADIHYKVMKEGKKQ
ncbi:hypothetical protein GF406_22570 [candidate division KSB1 bacterium]|nr:hypothetical protein [candidate division KSB1 bacterium]